MAERKNFRSNYYEKVGFKSVDVKKSLESILSEPVVDRTKLTQFVVKFEIPVQYRVTIWKYLLNISSCNKQAADFVWTQRQEQYDVLLQSLKTMRILPLVASNDDSAGLRRTTSLVYALETDRLPWPECSDIAVSPLNNPIVPSPDRRSPRKSEWEEDFDLIYDLVEDSLASNDDVETYWLCRNLHKAFNQKRSLQQAQMKEVQAYVWRKNSDLGAHLEAGDLWHWPSRSALVMDCLRFAFADVFRCEAVLSLWDKIVAGAAMAEVFVLGEILLSFGPSLMSTPVTLLMEKVERIIQEIPVINQQSIIDRALEIWHTEFSDVLLPNLVIPAAGAIAASPSPIGPGPTMGSLPAQAIANDPKPKIALDQKSSNVPKARKLSHFMNS